MAPPDSAPRSRRTDRIAAFRWPKHVPLELVVGLAITATLVALAVLAPVLAPHDPTTQFRDDGLTRDGNPVGPTGEFPLGTDRLGRDVLSRLLYGARYSLLVALLATTFAVAFGVLLGAGSALVGDRRTSLSIGRRRLAIPLPVESGVLRLIDLALAFPLLLVAILVVSVLGSSLWLLTALIAAVAWANTARVVHARTATLADAEFVLAARALGTPTAGIFRRHLLPNLAPVVLVLASTTAAGVLLLEASLSYLGVGIPPPAPSWGAMLEENVSYIATQPRLLLLPGAAIVLAVLGFSLAADALTDVVDPLAAPRRARP